MGLVSKDSLVFPTMLGLTPQTNDPVQVIVSSASCITYNGHLLTGERTGVLIQGPGRLTVNKSVSPTPFIPRASYVPHGDTLGLRDERHLRPYVR